MNIIAKIAIFIKNSEKAVFISHFVLFTQAKLSHHHDNNQSIKNEYTIGFSQKNIFAIPKNINGKIMKFIKRLKDNIFLFLNTIFKSFIFTLSKLGIIRNNQALAHNNDENVNHQVM